MPKIKVNGIKIYYEIHGEGFPFLLIRGLSSDVYRWPPDLIKGISRNFQVILFDNRGAGHTDKLLAENIPEATLIFLDNLAHDMFSQDPLLIAKILLDFLK